MYHDWPLNSKSLVFKAMITLKSPKTNDIQYVFGFHQHPIYVDITHLFKSHDTSPPWPWLSSLAVSVSWRSLQNRHRTRDAWTCHRWSHAEFDFFRWSVFTPVPWWSLKSLVNGTVHPLSSFSYCNPSNFLQPTLSAERWISSTFLQGISMGIFSWKKHIFCGCLVGQWDGYLWNTIW